MYSWLMVTKKKTSKKKKTTKKPAKKTVRKVIKKKVTSKKITKQVKKKVLKKKIPKKKTAIVTLPKLEPKKSNRGGIKNFGDRHPSKPGGALNRSGRPKGSKNKKTQDIIAIMEREDYDPITMAIKIARGEELTKNHPFLKVLFDYKEDIQHMILTKQSQSKVRARLQELWNVAKQQLSDSWVDTATRAKVNMDLMKYIAPQLKSTDIHFRKDDSGSAKKLTEAEVRKFKKEFYKEF